MNEITDAELIQYLDGELTGVAKASFDTRIAAAPSLAARLDGLRRRSARLSVLLTAVNPTQSQAKESAAAIRAQLSVSGRARWRATPLLKVAAAIVLILGVASAISPVRAWMMERVRQVVAALRSPEFAPRTTPALPTPPQTADVSYSFPVDSDTLELQLSQTDGQLVIRREAIARAVAEASRVANTSFLILPGALRIDGPSSAGASYSLTLPLRVTVVRLRRADRPSELLLLSPPGQELRVDLSN